MNLGILLKCQRRQCFCLSDNVSAANPKNTFTVKTQTRFLLADFYDYGIRSLFGHFFIFNCREDTGSNSKNDKVYISASDFVAGERLDCKLQATRVAFLLQRNPYFISYLSRP